MRFPQYAMILSGVLLLLSCGSARADDVIWNTISNYDADHPSLPSEGVEPAPSREETITVVKYHENIEVFPVDGDMTPYMQVKPAGALPIAAVAREMLGKQAHGDMIDQVFFGYGSVAISRADDLNLRELGQSLAKSTNPFHLSIVGHADKRVNHRMSASRREAINRDFGQRRADAVAQKLRVAGVNPMWIEAVSLGDTQPNAKRGHRSQDAADRRVEVFMDNQ